MSQIAENIKKFRELKNLTRDVIASKLEMSYAYNVYSLLTIQEWLSGMVNHFEIHVFAFV